MVLTLALPRIGEHMTTAVIDRIYGAPGTAMAIGARLLDLRVDLSAIAPQDCPPVAVYRLALRDRVWLREITVATGDEVDVGTPLARFTTAPDEPLDAPPARAARVTIAGIVDPTEWWRADP